MNQDFRDLFAEFNAHRVEFLVVGAHAWDARVVTRFVDQEVCALSREHLIRNKRASGRTQDLADLESLEG